MTFSNFLKNILEKVDLKNTKDSDYNQKTLKKGAAVEAEHSDNKKQQKTIAKQHFAEYPKKDKEGKIDTDYYEELDKLESDLKSKQSNTFEQIIRQMLSKGDEQEDLKENSMAGGDSSVFGTSPEIGQHGGQVGNTDWYAPGDNRNIFGTQPNKKSKKKRGKKMGMMPLLKRNMGIKS